MNRIHVDAPLAVGNVLTLPDGAASHLVRVLRLRADDRCVLFNGDGHDYDARITVAGKRGVDVEIDDRHEVDNESPLRIVLLQGIARGEKMDWILQKATELGVAGFIPVSSQRSEVRLDEERAAKRLSHWLRVVVAACEQCGRACVPAVAAPGTLLDAVGDLAEGTTGFTLDPTATLSLSSVADPQPSTCIVAIGPEGGWSTEDRAILDDAGFIATRLGPRILRAETAGIAAVTALQSRFGDLN